MDGCTVVRHNPESLRQHLIDNHGLSRREAWPYIDAIKVEGDPLDKAKTDYDRLVAQGVIVEKGVSR